MKILAVLDGTRGERRAYAAALARLGASGRHEVTIAHPPRARVPAGELPGARLVALAPSSEDAPAPDAPPLHPIARDGHERIRLSRGAFELARALAADALFLDLGSGLATVPALMKGPRKVGLRLDSWEAWAAVREPNLGPYDEARAAAHLWAVELAAREIAAAGGAVLTPETLAPGADLAALSGGPPDGRFARLGRPLLALVAPYTPAHAFDAAVAAFARVRAAHPGATLVAAGEGSPFFAARRPFADVALDRIDPAARAAVHLVEETGASVRALLQVADLVLDAPFVPGSGTTRVEALAAGVPLATAPPGDAEALAEAALAILEKRPTVKREAARSIERLAEEIEGLLR